ncbi:MAG: CDP-alcohol phosphatidyltransferase family protein [Ruminococcaceae bacterium]|jgi:cardiolipin synthase|nr:CDP-alcohol phosphatidyltransferase family protein [Oscillospiraceae bacterium]
MDHQFRKYLTKEQVFTIPNFMSIFRVVLLPFIIWTYWKGSYDVAVALLIVSAVTDVLDGIIARRFNMVSDLGKMLDPLCDKLTQGALLVCLAFRYWYVWLVFALLAVKDLTMSFLGAAAIRHRGAVHTAQWYGKLCTVILEVCMAVMILFPRLPEKWVIVLLLLCAAAILLSLTMYVIYLIGLIRSDKTQGAADAPKEEANP